MLYSIEISKGRYLKYCDKCWYETCDYDNRAYTHDEALAIANQLREHYVYTVHLVSDEGRELVTAFKPKVKPITECEDIFSDFSDDILNSFKKKAKKI